MADYLICPHCGKKIQDYAFAKALREGVGFVEELGRDVGPALVFWAGNMTGIRGGGTAGKKFMKAVVGKHGDPLVSKTIICPHCKKKFQA